MTGTHYPVTPVNTGPISHISKHLYFNTKRKQGRYWYYLLTPFGLSRPGIKQSTFRLATQKLFLPS